MLYYFPLMQLIEIEREHRLRCTSLFSAIEAYAIAVITDYLWFFDIVRAPSVMITAQQVPIRTANKKKRGDRMNESFELA